VLLRVAERRSLRPCSSSWGVSLEEGVAADRGECDERCELRVWELIGERGSAGDGGVELERADLAEVKDAVDCVDRGLDAGVLEGFERGADADVDL
jgi:hypothetical protein